MAHARATRAQRKVAQTSMKTNNGLQQVKKLNNRFFVITKE